MQYSLNISLTEDDYANFNIFHTLHSEAGKKSWKMVRNLFIALILVYLLLLLPRDEWSLESLFTPLLIILLSTLYLVFFKRILRKIIYANINKLKKSGKLPYEEAAEIQFYEDKLVDISPSKRQEIGYDVLEHIYVDKDRYIYIYISSMSGYILPISQLHEQVNMEEFFTFLTSKCNKVTYCK